MLFLRCTGGNNRGDNVVCPRIFHIYGPLWVNGYGLMVAIGFLAFTYFSSRRLVGRGIISSQDYRSLLFVGFIAGIVGGRLLFALHIKTQEAEIDVLPDSPEEQEIAMKKNLNVIITETRNHLIQALLKAIGENFSKVILTLKQGYQQRFLAIERSIDKLLRSGLQQKESYASLVASFQKIHRLATLVTQDEAYFALRLEMAPFILEAFKKLENQLTDMQAKRLQRKVTFWERLFGRRRKN